MFLVQMCSICSKYIFSSSVLGKDNVSYMGYSGYTENVFPK